MQNRNFCFLFIFVILMVVSCSNTKRNLKDYERRVEEIKTISASIINGDEYETMIEKTPDKLKLLKEGFESKTKVLNDATDISNEDKNRFFELQAEGNKFFSDIDKLVIWHNQYNEALDEKEKILDEMQAEFFEKVYKDSISIMKQISLQNDILTRMIQIDKELTTLSVNGVFNRSTKQKQRDSELQERENDYIAKIKDKIGYKDS